MIQVFRRLPPPRDIFNATPAGNTLPSEACYGVGDNHHMSRVSEQELALESALNRPISVVNGYKGLWSECRMQEADSNFFECKDYSKEVATATKVTVQHVDHIDTVGFI